MVAAPKKEARKVLVTGSSGMLGSDLCGVLSADYDVAGMDNRPCPPAFSGTFRQLDCDITDARQTAWCIAGERPDLIIHAAAWTNVDGCQTDKARAFDVNVAGTRHVVSAAARLKAPLFFISTDFVFDGKKGRPYTHRDRPNPLNYYAWTKREGEKAVCRLARHVIVRTSWLFGAHGRNFADVIIDKARTERTIKVVSDQRGSPTYTNDLAVALKKLLKTVTARSGRAGGRGWGVYHVSNKNTVSWYDYAKTAVSFARITDVEVLPIPAGEFDSPARRPAFSGLDTGRFERFTGHRMRSWKSALKEYINEKYLGA